MAKKIMDSLIDPNRKGVDDIRAVMGGVVVVLCLIWTIS